MVFVRTMARTIDSSPERLLMVNVAAPSPPLVSTIDFILMPLVTLTASAVVALFLPPYVLKMWPSCRDPRCFDYAHEMALSLSSTVHPCDDFYGYVCSNFARQYPRHPNFLAVLESRLAAVRNRMLNDEEASAATFAGRAVGAFRHCVYEYRSGREDGLVRLRELVSKLGIHWTQKPTAVTSAGLVGLLLRLSLKDGLPVLLNARLRTWPSAHKSSERVVGLKLDFEPVDPPLMERTATSIEYSLRAVAHNGTFIRFKSIAADVVRALEALRALVLQAPRWPGRLLFFKLDEVDRLFPFLKPFKFVELTNSYLPYPYKLHRSKELVTSTPTQVEALSAFLVAETPTGRALNLVRYLLFERLLPLASSHLQNTFDLDAQAAFRLRVRACMEATRRVEPRTWEFYTFQEVLTARRASTSARVVSAVLNATLGECALWQDEDTLARTGARLRLLSARGRPAAPVLSAVADINKQYRHVGSLRSDTVFLAWLTASLESGVKVRKAADANTLDGVDDMFELEALREAKVYVDPLNPVVRVSPVLMFKPFLVDDEAAPNGLNLGALGSIVGSLVAAFLDPVLGPRDGFSRDVPSYAPNTTSIYQKALSCLKDSGRQHERHVLGDTEAAQVLADQLGVRIAYAAFQKTRNETGGYSSASALMSKVSQLLGGDERAFFAAHCFQLCGQAVPSGLGQASSARWRCNMALRDLQPFWEAFGCRAGSAMRPERPCEL